MEPQDLSHFLARFSLREDTAEEVDAFVAWASARFPDGRHLQELASCRPLVGDLDAAWVLPAILEAGLTVPEPLEALRTLAFHEMRRLAAGEISPEEVAGNIDMYVSGAPVDHEAVVRTPELWNFCVYRRYLRSAGDSASDAWYAEAVNDIEADAARFLALHDPAPAAPEAPAWSPQDRLAAARSGVDLDELAARAANPVIDDHVRAAFYQQGVNYEKGIGVPQNLAIAVAHYLRGAELGDHRAQYRVGELYRDGEGVEQDAERSAEWFRRAYDGWLEQEA